MDGGMTGDAVGPLGTEIGVPGRRSGVAAEAKIGCILELEHVAVDGAVSFVADRTAFDPGGQMFMDVRAALVDVAFEALFLLEPGQTISGRWFVRIVAGGTGQDALLEPMPLVQLKLGENILVAERAVFIGARPQERGREVFGMDGVAGCAVERGLTVRAGRIPCVVFAVAGQAFPGFFRGQVGRSKGKDIPLPALLPMFLCLVVAGRAARRLRRGVRVELESLDRVFMTGAAGLHVSSLEARSGPGCGPQGHDDNDKTAETQRPEGALIPRGLLFCGQFTPP